MTSFRWLTPADGEDDHGPSARLQGKDSHMERIGAMYLLRLRIPGWQTAGAGQFAMLQAGVSNCFLPRAFSIHEEQPPAPGDPEQAYEVGFLMAPVGPGTEELSELQVGDAAGVLGPLGTGFDLEELSGGNRLVVVAGGVGAAPFPLLLERLAGAQPRPREILLLLGFRDGVQAEAVHVFSESVTRLRRLGIPTHVELISEAGDTGRSGLVTELLREELGAGDRLVVCGAHAMCEAVWDVCLDFLERTGPVAEGPGTGVPAWFSLEAGMACGTGSCQGCVIEIADGSLAKVCRQGPVFSGAEAFGHRRHPCALPEKEG